MVREQAADEPHGRVREIESRGDRARELGQQFRAGLDGGEHLRLAHFRRVKDGGREPGDAHLVSLHRPADEVLQAV